jgi:hypothetical protein
VLGFRNGEPTHIAEDLSKADITHPALEILPALIETFMEKK